VTASAPEKGAVLGRQSGSYYRRALSLTSLAGLGRLPQVSLPLARTEASPIGLSLIAAEGQDAFLLAIAAEIEAAAIE
jgi:amidase